MIPGIQNSIQHIPQTILHSCSIISFEVNYVDIVNNNIMLIN